MAQSSSQQLQSPISSGAHEPGSPPPNLNVVTFPKSIAMAIDRSRRASHDGGSPLTSHQTPDAMLSSTLEGLTDYFRKPCFVHSRLDDAVDVSAALREFSADSFSHLSHSSLVQTATGVRELAKRIGQATIKVNLRSVLIVTKARDNSLILLTRQLASWLILTRGVCVYVDAKLRMSKRFDAAGLLASDARLESNLRYWTPELTRSMPDLFDLVLTLGGDGTVLYTSWLFQRIVPPVLAFSLGSLGFLTNFAYKDHQAHLNRVFDEGFNVSLRMRFTCSVYKGGHQTETFEVINEIVIDRGPSPWISMLELYGNNHLLTVVQADGLILSTPTGSTAYSLSAGGSLVHPEIPAISVTPICPHTLSFRPMLLPDSMLLKVSVPRGARNTAWASFDGRHRVELKSGDYVTVTASQYPFPTVTAGPMDYIESVSRTLKWNVREHQKPFNESSDEEDVNFDDDIDIDLEVDQPSTDLTTTATSSTSTSTSDKTATTSTTAAAAAPGKTSITSHQLKVDYDWDVDDSVFFSSSSSSTMLSGSASISTPQSTATTGSSSPLHKEFSYLNLDR
ncbi:ATP-NAD kinase-like domain-containing protein [Myxozyma melibiosi]|uniref:ATP-NAD kinase-like domain-containing protein n=1 Tax=Myxozyma melibiosi TaxID=54550 RepID=A0ABR1F2Q5_9ASCO